MMISQREKMCHLVLKTLAKDLDVPMEQLLSHPESKDLESMDSVELVQLVANLTDRYRRNTDSKS